MANRIAAFALSSVFIGALVVVGCGPDSPTPTPTPTPEDAAKLDPPPAGQGFQFETDDIAVDPGTEEQDCYFYKVSELAKLGGLDPTKPVNLHKVQVAQRAGSHHMNLFRVKTIVGLDPAKGLIQKARDPSGECFKSPNWADWPLLANSQSEGNVDWTFPDGVVNILQPDEWIMMQTHYVNATTQKTDSTGKVRVNFWHVPDSEKKFELGTIFATKQSIRICQDNPTPEFGGGCQINSQEPVHIIGANGHFHSRGTTFDIYKWDGKTAEKPAESERFYASTTWDDPPMEHSPELDVMAPANGGIWYTCGYKWTEPDPSIGCKGLDDYDVATHQTPADQLNCCYTFGGIVERNEHCNAFVYYYPKQDDVFCQ